MYNRAQKKQKKIPSLSSLPDWGMFAVRPFITQLKMREQLPDLKRSLSQAERYGHHLDRIQPAGISTGTPIQMLSAAEEEEKKLMSGVSFHPSKFTDNKDVVDTALNVKNRLKNQNQNYQKDININSKPQKNDAEKMTSETKALNKDKNDEDHLTSLTKDKISENKAAEDTSLPVDPEVERLLNKNKGIKNNLPGSDGVTQEQNKENFIAPPSIYNQDKNTPIPKEGTRGKFLAKKEAMNLLGDNKGFATTQLAVKKVHIGNTAKYESAKAKDNQHQVKLKNAAELVRGQVINEDREVKEHVRGTFNLEPDIVAKEGGEELILQKIR
ncbi:hypothetical protein [Nostoc sphaeroides]|uniref:Uncharacterized protein n=1 Tax=Nostoc sphaeroides CCNUC1 TaxID=2653204 RepID=A0A5P8WDR1_9NOSO|nr:hypothetical protein [Nostoc sphaeroides]MCC5632311.1 hypothetical protein [Nostoc sphaeroides CHAB 2801]QFS50296.1 hypothetical protein GXM_07790 [Nostoc sphaeroides CCNUC1]